MPRLYDWYINKVEVYDGRSILMAHGRVAGHELLDDATYINTSEIISVKVNPQNKEVQEYELNNTDLYDVLGKESKNKRN